KPRGGRNRSSGKSISSSDARGKSNNHQDKQRQQQQPRNNHGNDRQNNQQSVNNRGSRREIQCYNCRGIGHIAKACPSPRLNDQQGRLGNEDVIDVKGCGSIRVRTYDGQEWRNGVINNALYVPNLRSNLFSIGSACDRGNKAVFTQNVVKIYDSNGNLVIIGH